MKKLKPHILMIYGVIFIDILNLTLSAVVKLDGTP